MTWINLVTGTHGELIEPDGRTSGLQGEFRARRMRWKIGKRRLHAVPLGPVRRREQDRGLKHYLLFYDVGSDYIEKRVAFRSRHLEKAWHAHERGELVLGGALADPVDGAVLLFRGESPHVAEAFAREDPYVTNGLVVRWRVREWATVVGEGASSPVRP